MIVNEAVDEVHRKETDFHDRWADGTELSEVRVREAFEAAAAPENRFILRRMGSLEGRRILDIGAGLGESSVYFALRGARVTAVDISPRMIELAHRLARAHGVEIEGVVSAAEGLRVPADSYDLAYMANLLHHVADRERLLGQVHAALKPGGRLFCWDPLAYNPVIGIYRRMATAVRTEDERPLTFADLHRFRRHFRAVEHREFWILSLALFLKYYLIDRVHPNEDRYWKRLLRERPARFGWFRALQAADALLTRLPGVRRLAWNIVVCATK